MDMSPLGRAASPLEARELEERATCELFGDKGCFTHCFAVGYCHSHCSADNICICTCKDVSHHFIHHFLHCLQMNTLHLEIHEFGYFDITMTITFP